MKFTTKSVYKSNFSECHTAKGRFDITHSFKQRIKNLFRNLRNRGYITSDFVQSYKHVSSNSFFLAYNLKKK